MSDDREARWSEYLTEKRIGGTPPPVPDVWEDSNEVQAAVWINDDGSSMIADPDSYDQASFETREGAIRFLRAVIAALESGQRASAWFAQHGDPT